MDNINNNREFRQQILEDYNLNKFSSDREYGINMDLSDNCLITSNYNRNKVLLLNKNKLLRTNEWENGYNITLVSNSENKNFGANVKINDKFAVISHSSESKVYLINYKLFTSSDIGEKNLSSLNPMIYNTNSENWDTQKVFYLTNNLVILGYLSI